MNELPQWVDPAEMQLDTRMDPKGRWVYGSVNDVAVPHAAGALPRDIVIRDDTLRSGGNTPGVYASVEKKLRIAALLEEMGVQEAEVGYGSLPDDRRLVQTLKKRGSRLVCGMHARAWLPNWKSDVDSMTASKRRSSRPMPRSRP